MKYNQECWAIVYSVNLVETKRQHIKKKKMDLKITKRVKSLYECFKKKDYEKIVQQVDSNFTWYAFGGPEFNPIAGKLDPTEMFLKKEVCFSLIDQYKANNHYFFE